MICPDCGADVDDGSLFCTGCGMRLERKKPASRARTVRMAPPPEEPTPAPGDRTAAGQEKPGGPGPGASDPGAKRSRSRARKTPSPALSSASGEPAGSGDRASGSAADPEPARLEPEEIDRLLAAANICRMRSEWTAAVDKCVSALQAEPANPIAHSLMGDIYVDQGRYDEAIQWYRMAIDLRPDDAVRKQLEKAEAKRASRAGREIPQMALPSGALGTQSVGTARLLGLTPRYWLRSVTLVSLVFLALVFIALAASRAPRRGAAVYVNPSTTRSPAAGNGQAGALPPPGPVSPQGSGGAPAAAEINTMGTGFPPDSVTSSKPAGEQEPASPGDQPAPIRAVVPSGSESSRPQRADAATGSVDGFEVVRVQHLSPRSEVDIELTPQTDAAPTHEAVVRAAFHAARRSFAENAGVTHAVVLVSPRQGASESPLFYGLIDRFKLDQMDPDTAPLDRLESSVLPPDGQPAGD
jgi:hypothetical protein